MDGNQTPAVIPDFIFGTLATDDRRLASIRQERSGIWHDRCLPLDPRPGEPLTITIGVGAATPADRVTLYYTTDGSLPAGARGQAHNGIAVELRPTAVEWDTLLWGYLDYWQGQIPPQPEGTHIHYIVEAWQSAGERSFYAGGVQPQVFGVYVDCAEVPGWLREAIIYQIFVDRFAPSPGAAFATPADPLGGFYGGTLRGITSRLDYLAGLGVTCLWLTPIFPSPTHHGYDATDYTRIEPRLGTEADFQELLEGAHQRGMRVILDYVANHCSRQHPAFLNALADRACETAHWFTFEAWPEHYRTFFGVAEMPQINTDHPAARAYLIDSARRWLERGVDGFRLDYANGPTHAFWSAFRAATRSVNAASVTIGEVVETPLLQRSYAGRMDGCLDFILLQMIRNFFAFRTVPPSAFDAFLRRHFAYFPTDFVLPSFLDNHDMNRFLWAVGGDRRRLRLAALCQFTLPGPPIIYYGTEVGLSQRRDVRYPDGSGHPEEARLPMLWGDQQDQELLAFYTALIRLRRAGTPTWYEQRETLLVDDDQGLLAYACGRYAVVLNNSPQPRTVRLPGYAGMEIVLATEPDIAWSDRRLLLPAFSGVCLLRL